MGFTEASINVLRRSLPKDTIKQRQGPGGMKFNYIEAKEVISLLNEAFNFEWSSEVISSSVIENTVVVLTRLKVNGITHEAYGSAEIKRFSSGSKQGQAVDLGNDYKSANSDAIKKAATRLNIGLELYGNDTDQDHHEGPNSSFGSGSKNAPPIERPAPPANGKQFAAKKSFDPSTFMNNGNSTSAPAARLAPAVPPPAPARPSSGANPFRDGSAKGNLPSTHLTALKNMADRKKLSPQELILNTLGNDVVATDFDQLNTNQAIEILRKAHSL